MSVPARLVELPGTVGELHDRRADDADLARWPVQWWWCRPRTAALVLGSAQPVEAVDGEACASAGVEVVRRRSGGSAVLVVPGEVVWVDLVASTAVADRLGWLADLRATMIAVGECWAGALESVGVAGVVHRGGMVRPPASEQVCFAGVGPGEVLDRRGVKLVGISQRRTSSSVRVQAMCHRVWRAERYAALLRGGLAGTTPPVTSTTAAVVDVAEERLVRALVAAATTVLDVVTVDG